ncbi:heavy metal-associated isoprenylated plant protein 6 [Capsella rubella]|nr:heavy metal-associated isoprenylated plant protein 6 [Capsella rubella]
MSDLQIVPVYNKVEAQYVEMMVPLYSYGCEKKVKRALSHLKGIYSVKVDYYNQKVTVWGICNKLDVLATVKKKRKEARFWNIAEDKNDDDQESVDDGIAVKDEDATITKTSSEKSSAFYTYSTSPSRFSIRPPLSLIRTSSFTWKAVKKVFTRSLSF